MSSANSGALLQSPSSFPAPLPVRFSRWKVSYPVLVRGQDSCSSGFLKSPSLDRSYHGRVMSAFTAELFEATLRRCKPLSLVCSLENSRLFVARCQSEMTFESSELNLDHQQGDTLKVTQDIVQNENGPLMMMKNANSILPHVVIASTVLALIFPPSFTWFTTRYWAPALGFLMFAVGVNSTTKDFLEAVKRPGVIAAGFAGQYIIKPLLGYILGTIAVSHLRLPDPIGSGIMLVSCVSGAQLSNYATFLTDPAMAPLSIVMTSLSTATAVFITPFLSLLLIGKRLPVDVRGMMTSIMQIVIAPIAAGLLLNRFAPSICSTIRPLLAPLSVLVTACCVGSPLAINMDSILSPFGITILLPIVVFHALSFIAGYGLSGLVFRGTPDVKALQRTISYETGMQSSLLALALANRFFQDPLVSVPPAISVVIMSLMGFSLVMFWEKRRDLTAKESSLS